MVCFEGERRCLAGDPFLTFSASTIGAAFGLNDLMASGDLSSLESRIGWEEDRFAWPFFLGVEVAKDLMESRLGMWAWLTTVSALAPLPPKIFVGVEVNGPGC